MRGVVFLIVLVATLYAFNPNNGFSIGSDTAQADAAKVLSLSIKDRSLADPSQADLTGKVGEKLILQVMTDEDGLVDLKSTDRTTFNPVFSGTINSISVATDRTASYQIEFHPQAKPGESGDGVLIDTIVIKQ